jgi:hypothetical protein
MITDKGVMNGDDVKSKKDLETLLIQNGGVCVQSPGDTTEIVIAAKKVIKVNNLIRQGIFDIVHYRWILECIQESTLLALEPK